MNDTNRNNNQGNVPQSNQGKPQNQSSPKQSSPQDFSLLKGVVAIAAGFLLIYAARQVFLAMVCFFAGAGLMYYGLGEIGWNKVQHYANIGLAKIKELWNKFTK